MRVLFFAAAVLLVIAGAFLLRDGFYIGSDVERIERADGEAFVHKCRYLFFTGTSEIIEPKFAVASRQQADQYACPSRPW